MDTPKNAGRGAAPGLALSFDDDYIEGWYGLRPLLDRHRVRATFFVTRAHRLDAKSRRQLMELAADGHEIGAHGYEHRAVFEDYGGQPARAVDYENEEVVPALHALRAIGLEPSSYAFPRGQHAPAFTEAVLRHFRRVRLTGRKRRFVPVQFNPAIYWRPGATGPVLGALGLDERYGFAQRDYAAILRTARRLRWVACFYAHQPGHPDPAVSDGSDSYRISPERIDWLLTEAARLGLRSYTVAELP